MHTHHDNLNSSAWAFPALTPAPPSPPDTAQSTTASAQQPTWDIDADQDTNYLPLFWLLDMSRDPCHCYSSANTENPYEHPFHVLARAAYDHKSQRERSSRYLSQSQFTPDLVSQIQTCLQVYADGQEDYHALRTRHAHNAVFWTGLRAGHAPLVKVALAEKRWSVSRWYFTRLAETMVECAHKVRGKIVQLLVADRQRFGQAMVERVLVECFQGPGSRKLYWEPNEQIKDWRAIEDDDDSAQDRDAWRDRQVATLVEALLEERQVNVGLVWEHLLLACLDSMVEPRMLCMGEMVLGGRWQLVRAKEAFGRQLALDSINAVNTGLAARPRARQRLPICCSPDPRLVLELPFDIQLHVVDALDFDSIIAFRSTCKHVRDHFPLGRFAQRFLERELLSSPLPRFIYSSARLQSLIDSVQRNQGPSTFDFRTLVEAVRHLDVDLAIRFLAPNHSFYDSRQSAEPGFVRYVYPWALYTLLFETDILSNVLGARRLLLALLTHAHMPMSAWIFLALAFRKTTKHLLPIQDTPPSSSELDPTKQYLLHLLHHGKFPPTTPDTVRQDLTDATSTTARLIIAFVLVRFTPAHFNHLVTFLPFDAANNTQLRSIYVRSLARLVPIDVLVDCGDVLLLGKVFHWMMIELEMGTCDASRSLVFSLAHQVCLRLQQDGLGAETAAAVDRMAAVELVEKQREKGRKRKQQRQAVGCRMCRVQ
ncbi:hypothetical protein BCR44DRAFT_62764 [Catenaria anguillulae PL171]|uniref:F-box domain-containing protein n=1 Tax=Catenaria anguillulae PL171 TaxID=765915 RepID=A0A1Y2I133_9FUNG|nr:hypothetical protein BCR44DRAFT_62764 [Catenaria anguillulae PL171]